MSSWLWNPPCSSRNPDNWNPTEILSTGILILSSTDRESGIQSLIPLLGAILTCVSALGWISCKQKALFCTSCNECPWECYNPEKSLATIFAFAALFLTSHAHPTLAMSHTKLTLCVSCGCLLRHFGQCVTVGYTKEAMCKRHAAFKIIFYSKSERKR